MVLDIYNELVAKINANIVNVPFILYFIKRRIINKKSLIKNFKWFTKNLMNNLNFLNFIYILIFMHLIFLYISQFRIISSFLFYDFFYR